MYLYLICIFVSYCARTDPADVARVESRTVICSKDRRSTIPTPKPGVKGTVGNWISPDSLDQAVQQRFPACMKGTSYIENAILK